MKSKYINEVIYLKRIKFINCFTLRLLFFYVVKAVTYQSQNIPRTPKNWNQINSNIGTTNILTQKPAREHLYLYLGFGATTLQLHVSGGGRSGPEEGGGQIPEGGSRKVKR